MFEVEKGQDAAVLARATEGDPCDRLDALDTSEACAGKLRRTSAGEPVWRLLDWQLIGIVNPCFELCYFLSQSVDTAVRRPNELSLLQKYYRELIGSGVSAEDFPWAVFLYQYQTGLAFCFYVSHFVHSSASPPLAPS